MDTQTAQSIKSLFPTLSVQQEKQLADLGELFASENKKVNLISRKDIDYFYEHHVLHACSVALFLQFEGQQQILDIGTGGGLPGIPLAILFPSSQFTLIDSIQKKIISASTIVEKLGLGNVSVIHGRVETLRNPIYDSVISRAVAPAATIVRWAKPLLRSKSPYHSKGCILLKGGSGIHEEISACHSTFKVHNIGERLQKFPYYNEKYILHARTLR